MFWLGLFMNDIRLEVKIEIILMGVCLALIYNEFVCGL